ncbi:MAG: thiamine-phosphate kinase [Alphaproteobacteria bacterium]
MNDRVQRSGEFEMIARYFAPLAKHPGAFGLKDDAAVFRPRAGREIILTTDAIIEGVHFMQDDPPDTIARKALRVNLSDLAGKGAEPAGYLLSLVLPAWVNDSWISAFSQGLSDDQAEFGVTLFGGDTDRTPGPLVISITAVGEIEQGMMVRREGARAGDLVFVSGTVGDGGAGLEILKGENAKLDLSQREFVISRYRTPEPRVALGRKLVGLASAGLDVSDGLIADLGHIAEWSRVRIAVMASEIPISDACRALWGGSSQAIMRAATAGDDYELAFAIPPVRRAELESAASETGVGVTEIGRVEAGEGVVLLGPTGAPILLGRGGFTHF